MHTNFEERIAQNPLLGALLLWEFTRRYEEAQPIAQGPSLLYMLPVLPILLSRPATDKLSGMRFESGLTKFVLEEPTSIINLQQRVAAFARLTLESLNLACASGLLQRMPLTQSPIFASKATRLPEAIIPRGSVGSMLLAARRLGAFFRNETIYQLEAKLQIVL